MALGDPYVTEEELAAYLRISVTGNEDFLAAAAAAASRWVEDYCKRQFNLPATATARTFDATRTGIVLLPDIGDATFTVETDDSATGTYAAVSASDYQYHPADAISQGWPITDLSRSTGNWPSSTRRTGLIRVTAKWGWPAVPDAVVTACTMAAAKIYKRRDSAEGVLGSFEVGVIRVGNRDPDIEMLLDGYRRVGVQ